MLPNGQLLNLYFYRKRYHGEPTQWHVALYLSRTRKEANLWYSNNSKRKRNRITGDGSLTGLKEALWYIKEFTKLLGYNEELIVQWEDEKRMSAYRFLKRYGFIDYKDEEGNVTAYGIRNPEYWVMSDEE